MNIFQKKKSRTKEATYQKLPPPVSRIKVKKEKVWGEASRASHNLPPFILYSRSRSQDFLTIFKYELECWWFATFYSLS
jgi:hypothetical protein